MVEISSFLFFFPKQQAFSVEQIKSMDSQQVYSLTKEQKSGFSTAQFDAMVSIERQDPVDPDPWSCKGNFFTFSNFRQFSPSCEVLLALL